MPATNTAATETETHFTDDELCFDQPATPVSLTVSHFSSLAVTGRTRPTRSKVANRKGADLV